MMTTKTRLTPDEMHHDGLCGVSIGDGPCGCLVHWVVALQKEADGVSKELEAAKLKIGVWKEYAELLTAELGETIGVAYSHGWRSSRHERGKELRQKLGLPTE